MDFTGERLIINVPGTEEIALEHIARYIFSKQFVRGRNVLDAGCGTGYGCNTLIDGKATEVFGIDISQETIKYCQSKCKSSKLKFKTDDVTKMSFEADTFDVITCFEVIEHVRAYKRTIKELQRVLKNDGVLIISTPNAKVYPEDNEFHFHEFEEEEFVELLQKHFKHVELFEQKRPITATIVKKERQSSLQ